MYCDIKNEYAGRTALSYPQVNPLADWRQLLKITNKKLTTIQTNIKKYWRNIQSLLD
jgi:hypothetical protein